MTLKYEMFYVSFIGRKVEEGQVSLRFLRTLFAGFLDARIGVNTYTSFFFTKITTEASVRTEP